MPLRERNEAKAKRNHPKGLTNEKKKPRRGRTQKKTTDLSGEKLPKKTCSKNQKTHDNPAKKGGDLVGADTCLMRSLGGGKTVLRKKKKGGKAPSGCPKDRER